MADSAAVAAGIAAFGVAFGLAARAAGLSEWEAVIMSALVFAGASQFAALGALSGGVGIWAIVVMTAALNARNLVYSTALLPWLADRPLPSRTLMGFFVNDAAFALAVPHFRRLGRADGWGFWWAAIVGAFLPWNLGTMAGAFAGQAIPDPTRFGLDVVFPAAMAGTAALLVDDRRTLLATVTAIPTAVATSLAWGAAGGLLAALGASVVALTVGRTSTADVEARAGTSPPRDAV
jgi:4-azaleucine resistance transporter AzlC